MSIIQLPHTTCYNHKIMVLNGIYTSNLMQLVKRFPRIKEVAQILNENRIRYGMFCSGAVETLTGYRHASDIDLLIDSSHVSRVAELIPDASIDIKSDRIQISLTSSPYIDFFGHSVFYNIHPFYLTDLAWENSYLVPIENTEIRLLHPLETILVKAIQQRGIELGKHDLEDARSLATADISYDKTYLSMRLKEIKADKRIFDFLKQINLSTHHYSSENEHYVHSFAFEEDHQFFHPFSQ